MYVSNRSRWSVLFLLFAITFLMFRSGDSIASTIDVSQHESVVLSHSKQFIAQDAINGVALYSLGDMNAIRRYRAQGSVVKFAIDPTEKVLVMCCSDGSSCAKEIASGESFWELPATEARLPSLDIIRISHNGSVFLGASGKARVTVYELATGRSICEVPTPPDATYWVSMDVSPDGNQCVLVSDTGKGLYQFFIKSEKLSSMGVAGVGYVRYSADGEYIAFRRREESSIESVLIVKSDGSGVFDLGSFCAVGMFRPSADGGFLLTVTSVAQNLVTNSPSYRVSGLWWHPRPTHVQQLWQAPIWCGEAVKMDFFPDQLIGITTDFRLVTWITDLRSDQLVGKIDNSANYRPAMTTDSTRGISEAIRHWTTQMEPSMRLSVLCGIVVLTAVSAACVWKRRRRIRTPDGNRQVRT
jgi:WD40 repeat protein